MKQSVNTDHSVSVEWRDDSTKRANELGC